MLVGGAGGPAAQGGFRRASGGFTVTGSGDIAPGVLDGDGGYDIGKTLGGTLAGLIAVVVVATMFITAEYRRGLIRLTLTAIPRRGHALAAKATMIGAVAFVTGTAAAAIALLLGDWKLHRDDIFIDPVSTLITVRLSAGTGALCAAAAILALAIGTMVRRSANAVTLAIVGIVFPYVLATTMTSGFTGWLLRIMPAAGFASRQAYPEYPQIAAPYNPGLFPVVAVGRPCRPMRMGRRRRPGPGRVPAQLEGRMNLIAALARRWPLSSPCWRSAPSTAPA